jgi:hypothetical protein
MKHGLNGVNSFFVEIILVILFFALSVSVTLQLFLAANNRARQSSDLSIAVVKTENIAEQIGGLSSPDSIPKVLEDAQRTASGGAEHYRLTFDRDWNEVQADPHYVIDVALKRTPSGGGTLVSAEISVTRDSAGAQEKVYKLDSAKYLPE